MKLPLRLIATRYWLAMIVVPISLAILVLSYRLGQQQAKDAREAAILESQHQAQKEDRRVLTDLCKTNAIIEGLVTGTITLFQYEVGLLPPRGFEGPNPPLRPALVNPKLVPAYLNALSIFQGWKIELDQQNACEKIVRP